MILSLTYSINRSQSIIKILEFISLFFLLLGIHAWISEREEIPAFINVIYYAMMTLILINLVSIVIFPSKIWHVSTSRFQGIMGQPNVMGAVCMVTYPFTIMNYFENTGKRRWLSALVFFITLALHILTGSRTTLFAGIIGIIGFLMFNRKKVTLLILIFILLPSFSIFSIYRPERFTRKQVSESGFTGRSEIWKASITKIKENPLTGYGYAVGGKIFEDRRFYRKGYLLWSGSSKATMHNGFLEIAVGVGVLGLCIYIFSIIYPFTRIFFYYYDEYGSLAISILLMSLTTNMFESFIVGASLPGTIVFWFCWALAGRLARD